MMLKRDYYRLTKDKHIITKQATATHCPVIFLHAFILSLQSLISFSFLIKKDVSDISIKNTCY